MPSATDSNVMVTERTGVDSSSALKEATAHSGQAGLERERLVWSSVIEQCAEDAKHIIAEPDLADRWAVAVGRWLADATLLSDASNLHSGLEALRSAHVRLARVSAPETTRLDGMITAFAETTRACLDRVRQAELSEAFDPRTVAARMLLMIDDEPGINSARMTERLGVQESQVSRAGRTLIERGLAVKSRHGKERSWRLTPRGVSVLRRTRDRADGR